MLFLALPGAAEDLDDAPTRITADNIEAETVRKLYIARGNVRIAQEGRTLTADWVAFSEITGRGIATGNVVVVEGGDTLYAEVLSFEVDTLRGVVLQGRLDAQESDFRMTGRRMLKTGDNTWEFEDATFTTCRCPDDGRDPWEIKAEKADLEIGSYGTARNTTFSLFGVPVLWSPWMAYPLATDRKTGFLLPEFNSGSRTGQSFGLPFFWAAADNVNITFTPRWLTDRGFQPRLEAEWLVGDRSGGELLASGLHDIDHNDDDPKYPFQENRWGVELLHTQYLPKDVRGVIDGRMFSDAQYAFDFPDFQRYESDRWIESVSFLERSFGPTEQLSTRVLGFWAQDHQNPSNQSRDRFTLQRIPQVTASLAPQPLSFLTRRLVTGFDLDYTYFGRRSDADSFYRDAPVIDDQFQDNGIDSIPNPLERDKNGIPVFNANADFGEGNGRFDEGEPLADDGNRLVMNPRLAMPFRLFDLFEVHPEVGWHGTAYQTDRRNAKLRSLVTGQLDVRTRLRNTVELPFGLPQTTHVLEPSVSWTLVSRQSQRDKPLLVPGTALPQERLRQLDPFNVTRDPSDRIDSASALALGFGNRFFALDDAGAPPRLVGDFTLSGQWDFANEYARNIFLDGRLYASEELVARFNAGWDLDENRVGEALLRFGWSAEAGHDLAVEYRYRREIPRFFEDFNVADDRFDNSNAFDRINQARMFARVALTQRWAIFYSGGFSFRESLSLTNRGGVEYISACSCWAVRVLAERQRARGFQFTVSYTLLGLGMDTVRPFENTRAVSMVGGAGG